MIEFKVSAPGKVILFGEHSVVYGKTAVAGSLNLRTTLSFKELLPDQESIIVSLPQTKLHKTVAISKIQNFFFASSYPQFIDEQSLLKHIENFVESICFEDDSQKLGLEVVFYLLVSIFQSENMIITKPFEIHVETELSISSGLGSSASFAVCIATCFSHYLRLLLRKDTFMDDSRLKMISQYAFNCEKIMHGTPSGIDNTICTFGSVIEFRKNECLNIIPNATGMQIVLIDTRVQRSTKTLAERVRELKLKYPSVFEHIFESMNNVAMEALKFIRKINNAPEDDESYNELSNLMMINQGLLSACGVSHPTLDIICNESQGCGLAAKLTGAGGGGYAYILVPPNTTHEIIVKLTNKLTKHGFAVTVTRLGDCGVKIH